jgi:peptidoglycan/LPS O-acetylase OafA/YrhL
VSFIRYQAHIDGLRAVAVSIVILNHLGDWFGLTGGFVGVDVFFVISGFLITSIVAAEIESGQFTFGAFYKRRVIRLAPAYFTVLSITTVAACLWLLPIELMDYARSMVASSVFMANFHMWKEVGGYFGVDSRKLPLLHLWSLAIEEQFYLFWPAALLVGHRIFSRKLLPWLVAAAAIAGVAASQWGVARYPAAAYYLLPTRFFELAVGAGLAYLPVSRDRRWVSSALSLIGVALILGSAFAYGKGTQFPGLSALAPVLGTALLIRWGEGTAIGRCLSTVPFVLVGKLSYAAYLWHWPIIAFLHVNEVRMTVASGVSVLLATVALSWLTLRWVEMPAWRFLRQSHPELVPVGAGAAIAATTAVAIGIVAMRGLPFRFPDSLNRKSEALFASSAKARGLCHDGSPGNPLPASQCVLGRSGGNVDFLLIGDSHANHFSGFMDELGKAANLRGYDMTQSNAPFLPGLTLEMPNEPAYSRNFAIRNSFVSGHLAGAHYRTVVLAGAWASFFNRGILRKQGTHGAAAFEAGFREALTEAAAASDQVVVLTSIPQLTDGLLDCSLRRERFQKALNCDLPVALHQRDVQGVEQVFAAVAPDFPTVTWVRVDALMCDTRRCVTELDGVPLYLDESHLNDLASRLLARKWIAAHGNPLLDHP